MKIIITSALLAITLTATAQNPDKALARVRYSFTHIKDTTQKDKPHTENMLLVIGKNASVYTSYDKINQELDIKKSLMEQMKSQAGSSNMSINIDKTGSKPTTAVDYFYFAKEHKFITKERLLTNYLIEEETPKIDWKINKDTASFSGVLCQKATAYFKGRNWIAWFAQDLPFQSGPWKLNGLPGLIIEAHDEKKEVLFQFAGIENINEAEIVAAEDKDQKNSTPAGVGTVKIMGLDMGSSYLGNEIKLPADAVKTTRKDLDKLKAARDKDPQGFMNAQMAAQGMNMGGGATTVRRSSNFTSSTGPKNVTNNPIELPETK
ncbi:GLPGLI family protein [Pedobacter cryotolerans]|uniref:GLPGLI family protein n=1 Tax=Pedobacter cryotolerans TaxID=2571270 RepID=A0A4U1CC48_9SPHI|nr:GLPGLI family protein [Pedobacter cryotolerans]TKC01370.1 GLPGLI family protein [Pedobacter cryotolerans]